MDSALAHALARAGYREGSSSRLPGEPSPVRFDQYCALGDPELVDRVCQAMEPLLPEDVQALAGRELGGVVLVTVLGGQVGLPTVFVRRTPMAHGTGVVVEGPEVAGRSVVLVEDVVHGLDDLAPTVAALRDVGAQVDTVVCLLDLRSDVDPSVDWVEHLAVHLVPLFVGDEVPAPAGSTASTGSAPGAAGPATGAAPATAGPAAPADARGAGTDNVVDILSGRRSREGDEQ